MRDKISKVFVCCFIVLLITGYQLLIPEGRQDENPVDIMSALSEDDDQACFSQVTRNRTFKFPEDFGAHPDFRTEWWYYTGNLDDETGHHYGYQLTIFRRALACKETYTSKWGTNQIFFAHFAVTDVQNKTFNFFQKLSRGSTGLSGAEPDPYHVWIENWDITGDGGHVFLKAYDGNTGIELSLVPVKQILLQGDLGYSQKSSGEGRASYYFSQTRLKTTGSITVNNKKVRVSGLSWFDKEWSTKALAAGDAGWDWFSLQLETMDITISNGRKKDGSKSSYSYGSVSLEDGSVVILKSNDFNISVLKHWKSPETGKSYPSSWNVAIPSLQLNLSVIPYLNHQEHTGQFIYWEGAVKVDGKNHSGHGYVEMTGY